MKSSRGTARNPPSESFLTKPRVYRWWGGAAGFLLIAGMSILFVAIMALIPEKRPGQKVGFGWIYLIGGAVGTFGAVGAWYFLGFTLTFGPEGVRYRRRWPFRGPSLLWSELGRIDYYVQQRRLGLSGRPSDFGFATEKIAGFRFWGHEGQPLVCDADYFKLSTSPDVVSAVFNFAAAPALRTAAAEGRPIRLAIREGTARQESRFKGKFVRMIQSIAELSCRGDALLLTRADGSKEGVGLTSGPDHLILELTWRGGLDVPPSDEGA